MKRKYGNRKITVNGITYDSRKEYNRHCELLILEKAGVISDLQRQVKFVLIPAQREVCNEIVGKGRNARFKNGKVIERECSYIADFVYFEDGKRIVEDVKGVKTKDYILKRKMMLYFHGIRIKET